MYAEPIVLLIVFLAVFATVASGGALFIRRAERLSRACDAPPMPHVRPPTLDDLPAPLEFHRW